MEGEGRERGGRGRCILCGWKSSTVLHCGFPNMHCCIPKTGLPLMKHGKSISGEGIAVVATWRPKVFSVGEVCCVHAYLPVLCVLVPSVGVQLNMI